MGKHMKDQIIRHKGMADASAAVHLSRNRFIVVSDESNVFQIYDAKRSGRFLQEIPLRDVIDIEDDGLEADLEASAKIGDITFWMSSHSRDGDGNLALDRHRIFATRIKGNNNIRIKQIGSSYRRLAQDLINKSPVKEWTDERLEKNVNPDLVKSEKGLNIEGLARYRGGLILGFRSPLAESRAILLPVINPLEMVMFDADAYFGEPMLLDLEGRGIRSIDYWTQRKCYLICANSPSEQQEPAYYLWSGNRDSKPKQLRLPDGANKLSPEGVVFLGKRRLLILSDDGAGQKDVGTNRKKKFRTMLIKVS